MCHWAPSRKARDGNSVRGFLFRLRVPRCHLHDWGRQGVTRPAKAGQGVSVFGCGCEQEHKAVAGCSAL